MKQYLVCGGLVLLLGCGGKSSHGGDAESGGSGALGGSANLGGSPVGTFGGALMHGGAPSQGGALSNGGTSQAGTAATGAGGVVDTAGGRASTAGGRASTAGGRASTAGGRASTAGGAGDAAGGNAGAGGSSGVTKTSQLDLLLMIDNSISMTDKQHVLARSLPSMLSRLIAPNCVDAKGNPTGVQASPDGACSQGVAEFAPVDDMHIGVITSSLGGHGSQTCAGPTDDDRAQLYPLVRPGVATWNNSGFLSWDPGARSVPPGDSDLSKLVTHFSDLVLGVNQTGCGFEAQLESWYRFLIDPNPPLRVPQVTDATVTKPELVSPAENPILQQRARFLRRDSVVVVLMLTDENDCSIIDSGQGWLVGTQTFNSSAFRMPRSTSACESNPNSPCCLSCASTQVANDCPAPRDDIACQGGLYLTATDDALNLRCFEQKRRFGLDFLHPTRRYIDGLTQSSIVDNSGALVPNPLFPPGSKRTPGMVFLAGIVGVPWQDIAGGNSIGGRGLEFMSFKELVDNKRWPLVLGDSGDTTTPPSVPGDKLMVETTEDRSALFGPFPHPLLGTSGALAPASSVGRPNIINGRERNIPRRDDLQYACIFKLPVARAECTGVGCECAADTLDSPLCDGTTQVATKGYPSVRELEVLKGVGDITGNAVVGSICPKSLAEQPLESYGYVPALSALVDALKPALR